MTQNVEVCVTKLPPEVGLTSLVGLSSKRNYPLTFGNYCSINGGPYLANMWAENLEEWARRNPSVYEIEITVIKHNGKSLGFVSDQRLQEWTNKKLCVTGNGWGTVGIHNKIHELLGVESINNVCGCENLEESPQIAVMNNLNNGLVTKTQHHCMLCGRKW